MIAEKDCEFLGCRECGGIYYDSDVRRVGDPSASDGSLTECEDCGAVDSHSPLYVQVSPMAGAEATGYLAAFFSPHAGQSTPMTFGESPEKAREALLDIYQLLI